MDTSPTSECSELSVSPCLRVEVALRGPALLSEAIAAALVSRMVNSALVILRHRMALSWRNSMRPHRHSGSFRSLHNRAPLTLHNSSKFAQASGKNMSPPARQTFACAQLYSWPPTAGPANERPANLHLASLLNLTTTHNCRRWPLIPKHLRAPKPHPPLHLRLADDGAI